MNLASSSLYIVLKTQFSYVYGVLESHVFAHVT